MEAIVRADASIKIGTGHIMRCLALAEALPKTECKVTFICRNLPETLRELIEKKGFLVHYLPETGYRYETISQTDWEIDVKQTIDCISKKHQQIDWLIVDNYELDYRWELQLRPYVEKIMAIDDLANRQHDCDLLLDQNFYKNLQTRYDNLVPAGCEKLLGPKYALLRPEFKQVRQHLRSRDGTVKRILVSFGGSDATNETTKALLAIASLNRPDIAVDVVVGASNPYREPVRQMCAKIPNANFYCQVTNMAELMAIADLAIAAGGTTTWERCFLGLPSITIAIAQNQLETTAAVASAGATWHLGWCSDVSVQDLTKIIQQALLNPSLLKEMSRRAIKLMQTHKPHARNLVVQALMDLVNATPRRLPT
ncbi:MULTISPECIES: UDP-2,4-diacetamido-2,4,6-trideoxy-beta-L-altropyranose hydrolase [Cyanophyceae]|uniref:UDP-2,4-diacetamido-2,4, 6-trideoxy-beta-L-altropyranose hydrolase n=1 Tax=Cyanophyceae TaxID=3028117 RepID=UPI001689DBC1|nr:UDP-2,4-diacetamido-2,4,6-trideoxy-beta-L-altropyranose hydrolase [Trichocoleus sp. FACHB-40]MBD2002376.1 UDP-2,4-diacetamido-2,4,6-trideoxy-beta-L-altropyranose hydrolase [Trichocoleus sp. FACHB-40]